MKTPLHLRIPQKREWIAWLVLTAAILLFAGTLGYAQPVDKTQGKIHIRMEKDEDGKTTRIDTTFDISDRDQARQFMDRISGDTPRPPVPPRAPGQAFEERLHSFPFDEEDSEEFRERMDELTKDLNGLDKRLKEMHFEMLMDSDFAFSPVPPMPPSWKPEDWDAFADHWKGRDCLRIRIDSSDAADRVIILDGDDGDKIEKALKESDGINVIIIRRGDKKTGEKDNDAGGKTERLSRTEKAKDGSGKLDAHLEYYPNPGNGRFTLSFRMEKKGDTTVQIFDPSGKEVYSETLKGFSGEYSNQLNISDNGKGAYMLKISQNGKSVTKKIVVE